MKWARRFSICWYGVLGGMAVSEIVAGDPTMGVWIFSTFFLLMIGQIKDDLHGTSTRIIEAQSEVILKQDAELTRATHITRVNTTILNMAKNIIANLQKQLDESRDGDEWKRGG